MHERILRDYFLGIVSAAELSRDFQDSLVPCGRRATMPPIIEMDENFEVLPEHLVRVCDDILAEKIEPGC